MPLIYRCAGRRRDVCSYSSTTRWKGRCPECGRLYDCEPYGKEEEEESIGDTLEALASKETVYIPTGLVDFDRVIGGGLVRDTTIVIGGDRGLGKSSLLVTLAGCLADKGHKVLYASGEESAANVGKIAHRLGVTSNLVKVMGNVNHVEDILDKVEDVKPLLFIVDSMQAIVCEDPDMKGAEGSISQGIAVSHMITAHCKNYKRCAIIVNHVTRSGTLMGSNSVDHMVDAVLGFTGIDDEAWEKEKQAKIELGEGSQGARLLYVDGKNRNGNVNEEALFEMTKEGLILPAKITKIEPKNESSKKERLEAIRSKFRKPRD